MTHNDEEPRLWEYDEAMRFVAPHTYQAVDIDGERTLIGEATQAEISEDWVADTKRRIGALNRAGISTAPLARIISYMTHCTDDDGLRQSFDLFEATLD